MWYVRDQQMFFLLHCSHLDTLSMASLLTGGTMKQTDGTVASCPERFKTFHLKG